MKSIKNTYDILIAGGGIMGSSIACHFMQADPGLKCAVIEMDPGYERASTTLSLCNIRIQFSLRENIQISQYAHEVLETFDQEMSVAGTQPRVSFRREGNLFLWHEKDTESARAAFELQKSLGCNVEWWPVDRIKKAYPLYEPADLAGGTFSPEDGHVDAYAMLMGYKNRARSLGAEYIQDKVSAVMTGGSRISGVALASGDRLHAPIVVNCCGAWASRLAATAGVDLPVVPFKRQVFVLDPAHKPQDPLPLTVLPSGLYFRSETGNLILLGKSMPEDPQEFDFKWDDKRFVDLLWPELAQFVPVFDTLKLVRGWAGLYAVNILDNNAILGEWPELRGFYLANGFSGHGLQQAPAVGRYLSELVLGRPPSLDLSIFDPQRIIAKSPLAEGGIV